MEYFVLTGKFVKQFNETLSWLDTEDGIKNSDLAYNFNMKYVYNYYCESSPVPTFHPFTHSELKLPKRKTDVFSTLGYEKGLILSDQALDLFKEHQISPHTIFPNIYFRNKTESSSNYNFVFFQHDCSESIDFKKSEFYITHEKFINVPLSKGEEYYKKSVSIDNENEFINKRSSYLHGHNPKYLHFEKMILTNTESYDFFTLYKHGQRNFVISENFLKTLKKHKIRGYSVTEYLWHQIRFE